MHALKILLLTIALAWPGLAPAGETPKQATLYKNPHCGCCEGHARHLREHGYTVKVVATHDLPLIKRQNGVPDQISGCHTTMIDGYVIEGHVPAGVIDKLLAARSAIKGISLPGMPAGSPGMIGRKTEPFTIYQWSGGETKVFMVD